MFKKADDFHIQVLAVMVKHKVTKSEQDYVELLVKKVWSTTYLKMIINHVEGLIFDLEKICMEIAKIQTLAKSIGTPTSTVLG